MPRVSSQTENRATTHASPDNGRGRAWPAAALVGVLCVAALLLSGLMLSGATSAATAWATAQVGAPAAQAEGAAQAAAASEASPVLSAYPPYSPQWRIGYGVAREIGPVTDYAVDQLCAGWYHDWGTLRTPPRPGGMDYIHHIRVSATHFDLANPTNYDWARLEANIRANPGALWVIGNEPDGKAPGACDQRLPTDYAKIYKIFYDRIKGVDSAAQVANGPIIQGTPVRMQWLTKVWDEYRRLYGADWPVDVWTMHNQIVREAPDQGADIPPGCDVALGRNYGEQDNDNMRFFIEHVVRMRQWMKDHGQQSRPLYLTEYGVLQPEYYGYSVDRVNEYMNNSFTYMLYARDTSLGMPADNYHLVQRWNWFSLNAPMGHLGQGGWNGNLFDPTTRQITEVGRNFARFVCREAIPTPTPTTNPPASVIVREAEGGTLHGAMRTGTLSSASDCRYVHVPPG
ncbi:MAG: hypothetical protein V1772_06075, partial [Chloroflexota bacterium]